MLLLNLLDSCKNIDSLQRKWWLHTRMSPPGLAVNVLAPLIAPVNCPLSELGSVQSKRTGIIIRNGKRSTEHALKASLRIFTFYHPSLPPSDAEKLSQSSNST